MSANASTSTTRFLWIHCNLCFVSHVDNIRKLFLLACNHVICEECRIEVKADANGPKLSECIICQSVTQTCEINNNMPQCLKELFHPQPYLNSSSCFRIIKFQTEHRRGYLEYLEREKNDLKEEQELVETLKSKEYQKYKAQRIYFENKLLEIRQQNRNVGDSRKYISFSSSGPNLSTGSTSSADL